MSKNVKVVILLSISEIYINVCRDTDIFTVRKNDIS